MRRQDLEEIQRLHELGNAIWSAGSLKEVLQAVADKIAALLPADRVCLIDFDLDEKRVNHYIRGGPNRDLINDGVQYDELQAGLSGWVLKNLIPAVSPKNKPDPREAPEVVARRKATDCGAIVVVPLMHGKKILGTITVINRPDQDNFRSREVALLNFISNYSAMIIENARLLLELKDAKVRAESSDRAKSEFLATMSHELRTPLNSILGFADLLAQSDLNSVQTDDVRSIQQGGEILLSLINDLLDLAKIEAGRMDLEIVTFDLWELLNAVQGLFTPQVKEKGLVLEVLLDSAVPRFFQGDAARIRQILVNLLGNAIKFTSQGRITMGVQCRERGEGGWEAVFEVSDTGMGIAADLLPSLFQPFVQGTSSITRSFGGTGLGLAICRQLCRLLGGDIEVESSVGIGSVFRFKIPLELGGEGEISVDGDSVMVRKTSCPLNILLVDDVAINRKVVGAMLRSLGHQVTLAIGGEEALELWKKIPLDLILMDVAMPGMDGFETTRKLRHLETARRQKVKVYAISAHSQGSDVADAYSAGMDGYLTKPVRMVQLQETLSALQLEKDSRSRDVDTGLEK